MNKKLYIKYLSNIMKKEVYLDNKVKNYFQNMRRIMIIY